MRAAALLALPLLAASLLALGPAAPAEGGAFNTVVCPLLAGIVTGPLERCNVRATEGNGPANEIDLAMDPADPDHLVVVGKGYHYTRIVNSAFQGAVITPYATSFDGGITWAEGFAQPMGEVLTNLPVLGPIGSTTNSESDPVVEFAKDGAVLINTLRVNNDRGLPVYRSTDGGLTFAEAGKSYNGGTDKNWIVTDPLSGNVYVATLHQGGIGVTISRDNGLTWSAPRKVCSCVFAALDVGAGGAVYVAGWNGNRILFTRSLDFGGTWSAPQAIAPHHGVDWNTGNLRLFRTTNIQQLAASRVSGDVYVAWADHPPGTPPIPPTGGCFGLPAPLSPGGNCWKAPNHDVYVAKSSDFGLTWGPPMRINDDLDTPLAMQFMPQVAVSPNGRDVHVSWLDQRFDPAGLTAVVYYAHSPDAGATWQPNLLVSDMPFLTTLSHHQSITNLAFVGDYMGLQVTDDKAVLAFPDTRYGRSDIFVATVV